MDNLIIFYIMLNFGISDSWLRAAALYSYIIIRNENSPITVEN